MDEVPYLVRRRAAIDLEDMGKLTSDQLRQILDEDCLLDLSNL